MPKSKKMVGRSSRTPVKHMILDKMVGKIAGVLSVGSPIVPCRANPFLVLDLCGGDGLTTEEHDASPQILHKHCLWLRSRGKRSNLIVFEEKFITYEVLEQNTNNLLGKDEWFFVNHQDSRTFVMPDLLPDQAAFVHCDPNCVDQIPLTKPFLDSWNRYTTYLVTLGCNVNGMKMGLSIERRSVWFDYIEQICGVLPSHHDAVLFWLKKDDSQWAYLLSLPTCWSSKFSAEVVRSADEWWPKGLGCASYRKDRESFDSNIRRLFLTKKEVLNADS